MCIRDSAGAGAGSGGTTTPGDFGRIDWSGRGLGPDLSGTTTPPAATTPDKPNDSFWLSPEEWENYKTMANVPPNATPEQKDINYLIQAFKIMPDEVKDYHRQPIDAMILNRNASTITRIKSLLGYAARNGLNKYVPDDLKKKYGSGSGLTIDKAQAGVNPNDGTLQKNPPAGAGAGAGAARNPNDLFNRPDLFPQQKKTPVQQAMQRYNLKNDSSPGNKAIADHFNTKGYDIYWRPETRQLVVTDVNENPRSFNLINNQYSGLYKGLMQASEELLGEPLDFKKIQGFTGRPFTDPNIQKSQQVQPSKPLPDAAPGEAGVRSVDTSTDPRFRRPIRGY